MTLRQGGNGVVSPTSPPFSSLPPRSTSLNASVTTDLASEPSSIFNLASLRITVPFLPLDEPPESSSSGGGGDTSVEREQELDDWVNRVTRIPEREEAYYDEHLPFYLLLHLPSSSPPLTREQAATFLLPSPHHTLPHLSLSAELSYVEGSPLPPPPILQQPPSSKSFGASPPPSAPVQAPTPKTGSSSTSQDNIPIPGTPSPSPETRFSDSAYVDVPAVSVWSYTFVQGKSGKHEKEVGQTRNFGLGRVWVGKVDSGDWVGVWEFKGDVAFVNSRLFEPKLCLTVTLTFRDDPRLVELLEQAGIDGGLAAQLLPDDDDDDEYLIESFDDVNLLDGLSPSLHLPASRFPLPSSLTTSLERRESLSYRRTSLHRHSLSLASSSTGSGAVGGIEPFLFPAIRRSFRRILTVRSALSVRLRTVACPIASRRALGNWDEGLMEENEGMGMAMCVEVRALGSPGDVMGFEVEKVLVDVGGGGGTGEKIDVREIDQVLLGEQDTIILNGADQHNFLYALSYAFAGQDDLSTSSSFSSFGPNIPPPVPIFVATSPSQRFTSRMDYFNNQSNEETPPPPPVPTKKLDPTWIRNVGITVIGKPVRVARSLTSGYTVPNSLTIDSGKLGESPTEAFSSRWNCSLDLAPCAVPAHVRHASPFQSPYSEQRGFSSAPLPLPRPISGPPGMSLTPSIKRASLPTTTVQPALEAIAGSKRHTISSLAALANRSPTLSCRTLPRGATTDTAPPQPPPQTPRRPLSGSVASEIPTPGATGPPKRFFSLRVGVSSTSSLPSTSVNRAPTRSESPFRPKLSLPPPRSTSSVGGVGMTRALSEGKRESWTKSAATVAPSLDPNGRKGLGLMYGGDEDASDQENREARIRSSIEYSGGILVSVALLPLRAVRGEVTKGKATRVGLLDVFLVEVFVVNQSEDVKRFTVGVPAAREDESIGGEKVATIIPLENDIRIGPLAPQTCHSVRLRFLAVRPGAHRVERLRLVDLATGYETMLVNPISVVVEP